MSRVARLVNPLSRRGEGARFKVIARSLMYRLLVALIVLKLARVTADYACSMSGEVVQPICCCDAAA